MNPLNSRMFWLAQLTLWISLILLTRFTWIDVYPPSWAWVSVYMGLGLLFSSFLAVIYDKLENNARLIQVVLCIVLSVVVGLVWRVIFNALEYHVLESANNQFKFWGYFHNGKSAVMQLLIWSLGYWILVYQRQLSEHKRRQDQLSLDAKEAQLKMLQYQIAPHFLFNVLSSIDTLLLKNDNHNARTMLSKLSNYLRHTLSSEPAPTQPLEQELLLCQRYLEIERMRFKEKLTLNWQMPDTIPECQLPNGVLLPLVENALKHGGLKEAENTTINITLGVEDKEVKLTIANNFSESEDKKEGFGIGLQNTRERLQRFFGEHSSLKATTDSGFFCVELHLPL